MAVLCLSRSRSACCSGRCDLAASGSSGDFAPSEFTATGTNQRDITASAQEDRADGGMLRMPCSMLCISTERARGLAKLVVRVAYSPRWAYSWPMISALMLLRAGAHLPPAAGRLREAAYR